MPDIPTLTSQAEELARTHSFWNSWSVIFVAVTAFAAVLYFIGQWMTNKRGKELNTTQVALIRAKDEQLARDLKEKDSQIADANRRAGVANEAASKADESAAKANERAQKLESDNLQLRTDLETATAEARGQQAKLAREQGKLADEQRKTADAQRAAAEAQLALKKYLDEVAARQADRKLSKGFRNVREIAVDKLDRGNLWPVAVQYKAGDDEAFRLPKKSLMPCELQVGIVPATRRGRSPEMNPLMALCALGFPVYDPESQLLFPCGLARLGTRWFPS